MLAEDTLVRDLVPQTDGWGIEVRAGMCLSWSEAGETSPVVGLSSDEMFVCCQCTCQLAWCPQGHSLSCTSGWPCWQPFFRGGSVVAVCWQVQWHWYRGWNHGRFSSWHDTGRLQWSLSGVTDGDPTRQRCTPTQGRPDLCSNVCVHLSGTPFKVSV